ncbi:MAG: type II toxin-antitoxin system ParD family antitoxin [Alphaproteobacteria bacterium]
MAKVTISMPDEMTAYVAARVESGQYGNVSEFFRDLVRRDQRANQANADLRALLAEAEASGPDGRAPEDVWAEGEARALSRGA